MQYKLDFKQSVNLQNNDQAVQMICHFEMLRLKQPVLASEPYDGPWRMLAAGVQHHVKKLLLSGRRGNYITTHSQFIFLYA